MLSTYAAQMFFYFCYTFAFIAEAAVIYIMATRIRAMSLGFRIGMYYTLGLQSVVLMMGFLNLSNPNTPFLGSPISQWVSALIGFTMAQMFVWVVLFHLGTNKWGNRDAG